MLALRDALEKVASGLRWLTARRGSRLLVIESAAAWRETLLKTVALCEHDRSNELPFVTLEAPWRGPDLGFEQRSDELGAEYEALREAASSEGVRLAPLPERSGSVDPAARFAQRLGDALAALSGAVPGAVVVLAPSSIDANAPIVAPMDALLRGARLERARWALIVPDARPLASLVRVAGSDALVVDARPDPRALERDVSRALEDAAANASGAAPVGVVPPETPGWNEPDPEMSSASVTAESPPALSQVVSPEPSLFEIVRALVLRAAAAHESRPLDAIRLQREAVEHCYSAHRLTDAVKLEVVLATYVASAGYPDEACQVLANARDHAHQQKLDAVASQAEMARAGMLVALRRNVDAATAYASAGRLAEDAGETALATEAYRLSGDLAAGAGLISVAADAWARALAVTTKTQPSDWVGLDITDLGTRLAAACEERGWHDAARALRERARAIETERLRAIAAETTVPMRDAFPHPGEAPPPDGTTPPATAAFPEAPPPVRRAKDRLPDEVTRTLTLQGPTPASGEPS